MPVQKNTKTKAAKAMALVELIVTLAIFVLAMGGITYLAYAGFHYYQFIINQAEIVSEFQKSINLTSKEIREMRQADSGAFAIELAQANELVFYCNIDEEPDAERIRYFREGNCLRKGTIHPTGAPPRYLPENEIITEISCNVTNNPTEPLFTYYNDYPSIDSTLPLPANVNQIKVIKLLTRVSSTGKSPLPVSKVISEYIRPRNINKEEEN